MKPTPLTNASPMLGPEQINDAYEFAEQGWVFRTGTVSARGSLPSDELFDGQYWQDTDSEKILWRRDGGAWKSVIWNRDWTNIGATVSSDDVRFVTGWSNKPTSGYPTASYCVRAGIVYLRGVIQKSSTINAADAGITFASTLRPSGTVELKARQGTNWIVAAMLSSGAYSFPFGGGTDAVLGDCFPVG